VPDGSLSTGQPSWQEFDHLLTNVASADQDFDANGYWLRVLQVAGSNGVDIGKLPVVGSLLGRSSTSADGVSGARPVWVGDLVPSDFQPGVSCSSQPIPSLSSATAAPDFRRMAVSSSPGLSSFAHLKAAISSAIAHAKGASGQ